MDRKIEKSGSSDAVSGRGICSISCARLIVSVTMSSARSTSLVRMRAYRRNRGNAAIKSSDEIGIGRPKVAVKRRQYCILYRRQRRKTTNPLVLSARAAKVVTWRKQE